MAKEAKKLTAEEAYETVSQRDGLVYHIAHARKENSADDYDGAALKRISRETVARDIGHMREAAALFRNKSIRRS